MARNKGTVMILKTCLELCEKDGIICFKNNAIVKMYYDELPKHNKWTGITLKKPTKQRTDKQNNDFHGNVRALIPQFYLDGQVFTEKKLKDWIKIYAMVHCDYPCEKDFTGQYVPIECSVQDTVNFTRLQKAMQELADDREYWLYNKAPDGEVFKSLRGRDRQQMRENYPEINGD